MNLGTLIREGKLQQEEREYLLTLSADEFAEQLKSVPEDLLKRAYAVMVGQVFIDIRAFGMPRVPLMDDIDSIRDIADFLHDLPYFLYNFDNFSHRMFWGDGPNKEVNRYLRRLFICELEVNHAQF
ncbi:hypothetical protein [Alicyclobacillus dauci]|uniref:Uncharacterized protein n=1 Tax=Alicyclobacillus dauci TaxID=1475485 RepID=A0ABY6Z0C3_9BACL|nr:hypothetical protein [Alicyclobacillus dauci]WAH35973.1 hypothetical protein NZD86_17140 [Alicyclobacillus dauci]